MRIINGIINEVKQIICLINSSIFLVFLATGFCLLSLESRAQQTWQPLLESITNNQPEVFTNILSRSDSELPERVLEEAIQRFEQMNPGFEWLPALEVLTERNPNHSRLMMVEAMIHWRAGLDDGALELSRQIVEREPESVDLLYRCAALAHTINRLEEARSWVNQLLELDSDHKDGLFLHGRILANEGDEDEARRVLKGVVDQNPNHFLALYELGRLENRSANSKQAIEYLSRAVEAFPFFKEAYNALLVALARERDEERLRQTQAIVAYLNQWSNEKETRMQFGFRNPARLNPTVGYELAVELHRLGRADLSHGLLRGMNARNRVDDRLRLLLAQYEYREENNQSAITLLEAIQDERFRLSDTFVELEAWLAFRSGETERAETLLRNGLERFPDSEPLQQLQEAIRASQDSVGEEVRDSGDVSFVFRDVSRAVGLEGFRHRMGHADKRWITDAMGSGVAIGDYDNDGDDDIYFVNGRPDLKTEQAEYTNRLFRNDGGKFTDVTEEAGVGDTGFGMAAVFGDVNNDGWLDLYVANYGPNQLYINDGTGRFENRSQGSGVDDAGYAAAVAFGDVDFDGDIDLFVGNYVDFDPEQHAELRDAYHGMDVFAGPLQYSNQPHRLFLNEGNSFFTDSSDHADINVSDGRAMGVVLVDLDLDGDLDLYVANDGTYNHMLMNRGDGTFEDTSFLSGAGFTESGVEGASMGVVVGDFTQDGLPDLLVTAYEQQSDVLYENMGDGLFRDVSIGWGIAHHTRMKITWGCGFADFDSDGLTDFYTANGHIYPQVDSMNIGVRYKQGLSLYRNQGEKFSLELDTPAHDGVRTESGRGSALLDFDADGDLDVVLNSMDASPQLFANETRQQNWIQISLDAPCALVFGARVVVRTGDRQWSRWVDGGASYLSQNSRLVHVGVGDVERIDQIHVHWVGEDPTTVSSIEANQRITISHDEKNPGE